MKSLILYTTKSGATKECAELLANRLNCSAYDITKGIPCIKLSAFDTLILGTGVRMGKIYKPIKNFMQENMDLLFEKRTAIFFCNAYEDTFQKTVSTNLSPELVKHAVCIKSFGGKPPFTKPDNTDWMNQDNINAFIGSLSEL